MWHIGTQIRIFGYKYFIPAKLFVGVPRRKRDIKKRPIDLLGIIIYYIVIIIVHPTVSWRADWIRKFVKYNFKAVKMHPIDSNASHCSCHVSSINLVTQVQKKNCHFSIIVVTVYAPLIQAKQISKLTYTTSQSLNRS